MSEEHGPESRTDHAAPRPGPAPSAEHVVVLVACGSPEQAAAVSRAAVEARVAACAQTMPIRSCYRWQGEIVEDAEALVLLKTRAERFEALEHVVRGAHGYEVPEIIALPIAAGAADYLAWIDGEVGIEVDAERGTAQGA